MMHGRKNMNPMNVHWERNSDYRDYHTQHTNTMSDKMQGSSKVKVGGV